MEATPETLWQFIQSHHRVMGKLPNLRECVERFDGKALNVRLCLIELPAEQVKWILDTRRAERLAGRRLTHE